MRPFKAWALFSPTHYWTALLICAAVLCVAASITFAAIERPFIELGKSLTRIGKRDAVKIEPTQSPQSVGSMMNKNQKYKR
jgi:peptidoglycan/LPS O-acetylase OafA/YrhL